MPIPYPGNTPYNKHHTIVDVTSSLLTSTRRAIAPFTPHRRARYDRQGARFEPIIHLPPAYACTTDNYMPEVTRFAVIPRTRRFLPFGSAPLDNNASLGLGHASRYQRKYRPHPILATPLESSAASITSSRSDAGSRYTRFVIFRKNKPLPPLPEDDSRDTNSEMLGRPRTHIDTSNRRSGGPLPVPPIKADSKSFPPAPAPSPAGIERDLPPTAAWDTGNSWYTNEHIPIRGFQPTSHTHAHYHTPSNLHSSASSYVHPRRSRTRRYITRFLGLVKKVSRYSPRARAMRKMEAERERHAAETRIDPLSPAAIPMPRSTAVVSEERNAYSGSRPLPKPPAPLPSKVKTDSQQHRRSAEPLLAPRSSGAIPLLDKDGYEFLMPNTVPRPRPYAPHGPYGLWSTNASQGSLPVRA